MADIIIDNLLNFTDLVNLSNHSQGNFQINETDTVSKVALLFKEAIQQQHHLIPPDPKPIDPSCQTAKKVILVVGAVLGVLLAGGIIAGTVASHYTSFSFSVIPFGNTIAIPWISVVIASTSVALAAICISVLLKKRTPREERFHPFVHRIFSASLEECGLSRRDLHSFESVKKLNEQLQKEGFVTIGSCPDLHINHQDNEASAMIKFLLTAHSLSCNDITWKLIKAVCFKRDEDLCQTAIGKSQEILVLLFNELKKPGLTPSNEITIEKVIGSILAFYPFFGPNESNNLSIPQKIQGSWEMVNCSTTPIQLTPDYLGPPLFCYGLKPIDNERASPLLLFMGTPHLTASGFFLALLTDTIPFTTIGESIYSIFGKKEIKKWLLSNKEKKAKLYGVSLGGSTALLTVADFPKYVAEVHAYSSPSPLLRVREKYSKNTEGLADEKPQVYVYCQKNDSVTLLGTGWHEDWHVINMFATTTYSSPLAHAKSLAGHKEVLFLRANIKKENNRFSRKITHIGHQIASVPTCLILSLLLLIKSGYSTARSIQFKVTVKGR